MKRDLSNVLGDLIQGAGDNCETNANHIKGDVLQSLTIMAGADSVVDKRFNSVSIHPGDLTDFNPFYHNDRKENKQGY